MFGSAYQKILRIRGTGRDNPNNKESGYEHGSIEQYIGGGLVRKDKYLVRNGASLFKELVKSTQGKNNPFRIFSLKELQKATNNFSADMILNYSSNSSTYSRSYRGIIEGRHIAVKIPRTLLHTLVAEVVSLSLINHRNVMKLLGCCIETRNLIVVLEFPPNGTLTEYIVHRTKPPPVEIFWTNRLKIATEIADVVAYLHFELHMSHGRLWYAEVVLLDEFYSAKLCAFDFSQIQNQAQSSDVETNIKNKFRKREDVYGFGNILLNLLGIDFSEVDECYDKEEIVKHLKLNVSEKEMPQIEAYIDLLLRCLSINAYEQIRLDQEIVGEDELSMYEVVGELRRIRSMINHQPTTDGNESDNLSSGANPSSSNNA